MFHMRLFFFLASGVFLYGAVARAAEGGKDGEGWKSSRFLVQPSGGMEGYAAPEGDRRYVVGEGRHPHRNGRIGALIYGGVGKDHLELTEISMWSGGFCSSGSQGQGTGFPEIRVLSAVWNA